jgi:PAS domain S-box-containing protein
MTAAKATYEEMKARLRDAESVLAALRNQEVDAIVGDSRVAVVRLAEVEESHRQVRATLEREVAERTTDLARANERLREIIEQQASTRGQLEAAQQRLLKAQQLAHVGNWEWDPRSNEIWWSDEACRLFGLEPSQMIPNYEGFLSFVHPEDRQRLMDQVRDVLENKRPYTMELRIVRADGQERFLFGETEIDLDGEGNVARFMGVARDITEEKRAREQLERCNRRLREQADLLDLAHDMIFVHDMEGRIVFWNRGAERRYGWKGEEALGRLSDELLHTEYREPLIRITSQIIRDGWWEGELTHTTREGKKVAVATRWALRRGADGSPTAILEIDNDITERRCAELETAEARRLAESIVDTIQECLVVLDSQLRVVSANRSFHETFRAAQEQVQGRFFLTLNDGLWDLPELRQAFRNLLTHGESFQGFEVECGSAGGGRTLVLGARPVRDQPVGAGMILVVLQDVTVCKRQEREIRTDKQQLASLTEELMLVEDRQRRQIAEVLRDFVGGSLTGIEQELGLLHQDAPAPARDSLQRLREQARRAVEWTGSLARELNPAIQHPEGLAGTVRELAEQFRDSEGFACRVHAVQTHLPLISPVRTLLYRAIRELLVNVTKHAGAENVEITLDRDERNVRICVADDGRGFDLSVLKSARTDGGLGIRGIRERLTGIGGDLIIDSIEGRGTRVTLVAPLDLEDGSDRGAREHAEKD